MITAGERRIGEISGIFHFTKSAPITPQGIGYSGPYTAKLTGPPRRDWSWFRGTKILEISPNSALPRCASVGCKLKKGWISKRFKLWLFGWSRCCISNSIWNSPSAASSSVNNCNRIHWNVFLAGRNRKRRRMEISLSRMLKRENTFTIQKRFVVFKRLKSWLLRNQGRKFQIANLLVCFILQIKKRRNFQNNRNYF